jgi:methylase of polypeptide subunit release factors
MRDAVEHPGSNSDIRAREAGANRSMGRAARDCSKVSGGKTWMMPWALRERLHPGGGTRTHSVETAPFAPRCNRMDEAQLSLLKLGNHLRRAGYRFITPAPATHSRVLIRDQEASTLADIFGWNRRFRPAVLPAPYADLLEAAGALLKRDGAMCSGVRFSSLDRLLLMHSAFPTDGTDSVFFGPDTYRFAREIRGLFERNGDFRPSRVFDIGAGTGAGGFVCEGLGHADEVLLVDINQKALRYCEVNAALNHCLARPLGSDLLRDVEGTADLIVSNPPYLVDAACRTYRHGGGDWGGDLSVRILAESLERLATGGKLLLYTGSAIVDGVDTFFEAAHELPQLAKYSFRYNEVDPDVFGEELERTPYDRADRIAAVCLTIE